MRKRTKQTAALALALGLALAGNLAAYAAASVEGETKIEAPDGTAVTELVGTINITKLSVTMPLKVAFDVDPSAYTKTGATALSTQITNPTNYEIVNNSAVPVKVYIDGLSKGAEGVGADGFTLETDKEKGTKNKTILLAIKETGVLPTYDDVTTDYWLSEADSGLNYYMDADKKGELAAASVADGSNKMTLKVYGQTQNGWSQNDKFSIKPIFKVETVAATTPSTP